MKIKFGKVDFKGFNFNFKSKDSSTGDFNFNSKGWSADGIGIDIDTEDLRIIADVIMFFASGTAPNIRKVASIIDLTKIAKDKWEENKWKSADSNNYQEAAI